MKKGILLIVSGPSGVGKGTVSKALLNGSNGEMTFSVSATTRAPRPGEVHGVDYFYVSKEEFDRMIEDGEFLEYMNVFGRNYYGTPRKYVEEQISMGRDVLLDIDVHGAMNVKKNYPEAVAIMLAPFNEGAPPQARNQGDRDPGSDRAPSCRGQIRAFAYGGL